MSDPSKPSPGYKAILRTALPNSLVKERDIYLRLGPKAGPAYVRLKILDAIGLATSQRAVPKTSRSFLFVCFGNIMRSPMAAALLRKELNHLSAEQSVRISSAGMHAIPGNAAHPWALAASQEFGISLHQHRAQLLTAEMVHEAEAIFAMDFQNQAELLTLYPDSRHKVFMLSSYFRAPGRRGEIPDPYFGNVETTRNCYQTLQTCARNLAEELFQFSNPPSKQ